MDETGRPEKRAAPECSELVESVHACSRSLKDHLAQLRQPAPPPSASSRLPNLAAPSSAPSSTNELSRKTKINLQGVLAESLDDLLGAYVEFMVGSAEDRVMKPELENLRSYFRRTARGSKSQEGRQELIGGTSRRFIEHGVGASRRTQPSVNPGPSSTSSPAPATGRQQDLRDGEDNDSSSTGPKKARLAPPEIEQKIRAGRLADNPRLPEIRQVVKTSHPCHNDRALEGRKEDDDDDDGSEDDGELKVYDD
ncbi:hypothetical protein PTTG_11914 [Puccinia triticina 1-1 BBBD Race 1]|uniref:Uncharacterized protein n=1 Tax=Puccinia triticina (isolate 1-1 / race 1 (BBBD)) TaxID=630390 RepID=A0A180GNX4_PUCT1|nr:hypothetical protein PTTG_11914 [Puccinia triticina 1-1 BBBD Race 1]